LTGVLGYLCAVWLVPAFGLDPHWGVPALTASAGFSGWLEFALLRRALMSRIGSFHVPGRLMAEFWGAAAIGCGFGWLVRFLTHGMYPAVAAVGILGVFGLVYFAALYAFGNENARTLLRRIRLIARLS
jgi:putative peptidoglycan lipid II flippase